MALFEHALFGTTASIARCFDCECFTWGLENCNKYDSMFLYAAIIQIFFEERETVFGLRIVVEAFERKKRSV